MVVSCFLNILCLRHVSKHYGNYGNYGNYGKHGRKWDCDNWRQASTCNTKAKSNRSHWWRVMLGNFQDFEAFPNIFFSCFVRTSERGSKRHRKKSQSQLCWSIPDFIRALLVSFWFLFLWRFIFSLHSLLSWPVKVYDIFYLMKMKGTFRSVVCRNSQSHPYVQMVLRALADESQQHRRLSNVLKMETGNLHIE